MSQSVDYNKLVQQLSTMPKDESDRRIESMYTMLQVPKDDMKARVDELRTQGQAEASRKTNSNSSAPRKWTRSSTLPTWKCEDCAKEYKKLDYASQHIHKYHKTNAERLLQLASAALAQAGAQVVQTPSAQGSGSNETVAAPSQAQRTPFDSAAYFSELNGYQNHQRR